MGDSYQGKVSHWVRQDSDHFDDDLDDYDYHDHNHDDDQVLDVHSKVDAKPVCGRRRETRAAR